MHQQALRLQAGGGVLQLLHIATVEHDGGAGLAEAARQRQADAGRGTGDERNAPVEAKGGCVDHALQACSSRTAWATISAGGCWMSIVTGASSTPGGSSVASWLWSSDAGM